MYYIIIYVCKSHLLDTVSDCEITVIMHKAYLLSYTSTIKSLNGALHKPVHVMTTVALQCNWLMYNDANDANKYRQTPKKLSLH